MFPSKFKVLHLISSSFWVTVLVVRVGCIIEAHPSPNSSNGYKVSHHDHLPTELETAASHSIITSPKNGLGSISRKASASLVAQQIAIDDEAISISTNSLETTTSTYASTTTSTTITIPKINEKQNEFEQTSSTRKYANGSSGTVDGEVERKQKPEKAGEDNDNCAGKGDGYYQNFGAACTSYYFCAAGYQITYVCPIGLKFNGKRCQQDYNCPTAGHVNDCKDKSNGYYVNKKNVGKYFYCYQQAKVIELQCDTGKVFMGDKCTLPSTRMSGQEIEEDDKSCSHKSNGFYQDLLSNCKQYYYCIGGEKRELKCQDEYIFNGDICVHRSRYQCPSGNRPTLQSSASSGSTSLPASQNPLKKGPKSIDHSKRATSNGSRELEEKTKLAIIGKMTTITPPPDNLEKTTVDSNLNDPNNV